MGTEWADLKRQLPRLAQLEAAAMELRATDPSLPVTELWYGHPGYEPGFKRQMNDVLQAADVLGQEEVLAYHMLFLALSGTHDAGVCTCPDTGPS